MPAFRCKTRDAAGASGERTLVADSRREVLMQLEAEGLVAVDIEARGEPANAPDRRSVPADADRRSASRGPRVKRRELLQLSLQLSSALRSGIPVVEALRFIERHARDRATASVVAELVGDLERGSSLSAAMRRHPGSFPLAYVGTVQAGEASGTLDAMLEDLAEYLESELETRSDVRSAVLYPSLVVGALTLAIGVLIVFVVPRFASVYAGLNAELPLPTRLLIGASSAARENALVLGIALAGTVAILPRLVRVPPVRAMLDRLALRLPFFGGLLQTAATLRVVQMLGLLTRAGVPIVEGLGTIAAAAGNSRIRAGLEQVTAGVSVGSSIAAQLEQSACFPPAACQMLASGEASGTIEQACFTVARHYKKDLRYRTKNVATFIEPLMTLVLAVVVLFVALAVFLPMWNLASAAKG